MIWLSLLTLNPRSRQVQNELRNPYEMHRTLSRAFPDGGKAYRDARCLFRVEEDEGSVRLLVQSLHKPDWSFLASQKGYTACPPAVKQTEPHLAAGQVLAFRLRANPTVRRDGKRFGLYKEEERTAWLQRKGRMHGFTPLRSTAKLEDKGFFHGPDNTGMTFSVVRFDGFLRVDGPAKLSDALRNGIGSGKAFGFGLLSLAPLR